MHRSHSFGGAAAFAAIIAFLLAECGAEPVNPPTTTAPDSTVSSTTVVVPTTDIPATTVGSTTTTAPETTTTVLVGTTAPATTRPTNPTTTTTTLEPPAPPAPTTAAPTTAAPTTAAPPPTAAPTTAAPTTATPTTAVPTTAAPTTAAPTTVAPVTTAAPPPTDPPAPAPTASPSADAIALTNQQREAAGLSALSTSGALNGAAAQHSTDQAARNSMGHTGSDGSSAGDRISANGGSFRTWAENVAAGYRSASSVVDGWMNSPGHRANILNPSMTQIGVAVATAADGTPYWTMVLSG